MAIKIQFEAGTGRHFQGGVNYLIALDSPIYVECPVPDGASDDYGYLTMKKALLTAIVAAGMDANGFEFQYDNQEQYLAPDANAKCDVHIEI